MASKIHIVVDHEVALDQLAADDKKALLPVLRALPLWHDAASDTVKVSRLSGGMTNFIFRCSTAVQGVEVVVLVRVNGGEVELFDRKEELEIFKAVSQNGMGPRLLAVFRNGRVEEFLVKHTTFLPTDIQNSQISPAVAASVADFHLHLSTALGCVDSKVTKDPILWRRLHDWLRMVDESWKDERPPGVNIGELSKEVDALRDALTRLHPLPIGFCHNDLQYGNIMRLSVPHLSTLPPPTPSTRPTPAPTAQPAVQQATPMHTTATTNGMPKPSPPLCTPPHQQDDTCLEHDSNCTDTAYGPATTDKHKSTSIAPSPCTCSLPAPPPAGPPLSPHQTAPAPTPSTTKTTGASDAVSTVPQQDAIPTPIPTPIPTSAATEARPGSHVAITCSTSDLPSSPAPSQPPLLPEHVTLIDFEFSGFSSVAFDIGNHWCEWAANYHTDTPHLLDYSKYPSPSEQSDFAAAYLLRLLQQLDVGSSNGNMPTKAAEGKAPPQPAFNAQQQAAQGGHGASVPGAQQQAGGSGFAFLDQSKWLQELVAALEMEGFSFSAQSEQGGRTLPDRAASPAFWRWVSELVAAANDYVCLSHLQWALWGYIQAKVSSIDFDFIAYADQRMVLYHQVKRNLLDRGLPA